MIGDFLNKYTFRYLLSLALSQVSDDLDKREGSIIYTALAPFCYILEFFFINLKRMNSQAYIQTATGEYLDYKVAEQGMIRFQATKARVHGEFKDYYGEPLDSETIKVGMTFGTNIMDGENVLQYTIIATYVDPETNAVVPGEYILEANLYGTIGNQVNIPLASLVPIENLTTARVINTYISGRNIETDDELRSRYIERVKAKPFGGNIAQYKQEVGELDGVGGVQVYPVWNGGGTVKLSIVDNEIKPIDTAFIAYLQDVIDPENSTGVNGLGLGMAPIGHKVTVTTPEEFTINVAMTVTVKGSIDLPMVQQPITKAIEDYFTEERIKWPIADTYNEYSLSIFIARIISAVLEISGIINVTNVTLNGGTTDVVLLQDATTQQLPKLGTVSITVVNANE